ncbi:MAG: APC family permease [Nitrososphaerota archaeon]|nr:APC family permease [Nitrososphaerota archaeon]MDG7026499.1 APC family permease [Nitrososphaerota archaeon]
MAEIHGAFARKTSGVVRDVSLRDAFIFGISLAIPFAANFFLFPLYEFLLPGADWTTAVIIGFALSFAAYALYASFGSMMPRSGGDYVFQSRGVHPILSFLSVISLDVFLQAPVFLVILMLSSAELGFSPFLTMAGAATGNTWLISAGTWAGSPWGLFTIAVIFVLLALAANVAGLKWVGRSQRYILFPIIIISGVVITALLFSSTPSSFETNFNNYGLILNGTANTYGNLINAATSAGFTAPAFSWLHTIYLAIIIATSFLFWTVWTAPFFGEIKGANNFRNLFLTFVAGGAFQAFFLMIPELAGFQHGLGSSFLSAAAFQGITFTPTLSFYPSFGILTLMTTNNVIVMFLASVGFMVAGYFMAQLFLTNMSRYLLAGSIDGALPLSLSSPSRRFKTPLTALVLSSIVVLVWAAIVDFTPTQIAFWTDVAVWTGPVIFFGTSLSGILFQWTNPSIYKNSLIAKYKGLLLIASLIVFALVMFVFVGYVIIPELEVSLGYNGLGIIFGVALAGLLWYFGFKWYQKKRGIDIGLAYKEIPPE